MVEDYRAERARQWSNLIELTGGYDTEIADRLRELRDQGTPLITYKDWLVQSKRPPEEREMPENNAVYSTALVDDQVIGDPAAEQSLLATVMTDPTKDKTEALLQLRRGEFSDPLHQVVYDGIAALHHSGIEPATSTVENWIRENNLIARSPVWDSRFYRPTAPGDTLTLHRNGISTLTNRADLGLRGWHALASPDPNGAQWLASVVRDHTILRMTTEAHEQTATALKAVFAERASNPCDIGQETARISWTFESALRDVPPELHRYRPHEQAIAEGVAARPGSAMAYANGAGAQPAITAGLSVHR
jgi:hypothetical protein